MNPSFALVVIQPRLAVGGIESYFAQLMNGCVRSGAKVFWLCDDPPMIDESLTDYLQNINIIPVRTKYLHRYMYPRLELNGIKRVALVCAYTKHLAFAELLREYLTRIDSTIEVNAFYLMPHFTGYPQFPDTAFHGLIRRYIFKRYRSIVKKWIDRLEFIYFAPNHFNALNDHYALKLDESSARLVPPVAATPVFDYDFVYHKAQTRRNCFSIVSASRLDFPHKGYIIGLIDEFAELLKEFPQAKLKIIGDGPSYNELISKIDSQERAVKDRISFEGFVSPATLDEEMRKAHLNIGVAGSLLAGARQGTLSLPMRHYTISCESPGYLNQKAAEGTLVTAPCGDAYNLIRHAVVMSDEEYVDCSYHSYLAAINRPPDYMYFSRISNRVDAAQITHSDLRFIKRCMQIIGIKTKTRKLLKQHENIKEKRS